jgi:hypothetical protein
MSFSATAAPGAVPRDSARPPTRSGVLAPPPGVAVQTAGVQRPTAARRITVEPAVWTERPLGFPTQHPYVRRFWTAAIGAGAVADLMRLAVAAQRGRPLLLPTSTELLTREGLVTWSRGRLLAGISVPPVPDRHIRRMPPPLRREHRRIIANLPTARED